MPPTTQITPHGFTNLGGIEKTEDVHDVKLGAAGVPVYNFPAVLMNDVAWAADVEYQGQQPACGAHGGAKLKSLEKKMRFSPRFTWGDIKSFDGFPIDSGTDMRSVFKSITKTGTLEFPLLGNDISLDKVTYAHPNITAAMKVNSTKYSGDGYGFIQDLSFKGIKQFISDHGPSALLVRVGKEWWTDANSQDSWEENDIMPLRTPKAVVSGHFVVAHSYDEKYIYFINSWSHGWAKQGHGYFGENYIPWVIDVGTLFPLLFTKDLQRGMTDPDVKRLQEILNKNHDTQIATTGNGSLGHETEYFGDLTFQAVKKYQTIKNIPATGYVGPLTRASLNTA